jgi:hypothetical protein
MTDRQNDFFDTISPMDSLEYYRQMFQMNALLQNIGKNGYIAYIRVNGNAFHRLFLAQQKHYRIATHTAFPPHKRMFGRITIDVEVQVIYVWMAVDGVHVIQEFTPFRMVDHVHVAQINFSQSGILVIQTTDSNIIPTASPVANVCVFFIATRVERFYHFRIPISRLEVAH